MHRVAAPLFAFGLAFGLVHVGCADPGGMEDSDLSAGGEGDATSGETGAEAGDAGESGDTGETTGGVEGGTPGCGLEIDAGTYGLSVMVAGQPRNYWVSIPEGYDPLAKYPLVFAWHGLGGDGALARAYYGIEEASAGAAIFLYPDGLHQATVGGTGWDLSGSGDDMKFFDALFEQLSDGACIDVERVFSTGHSFGGYMSNALACFRGDTVRAIGEVAGGPYFGGGCTGPTAAWMAHDPSDTVVEFSQGTSARDQRVAQNECGATTSTPDTNGCVAYEGCLDGMPVTWCEHDQGGSGGHSWPPFAGTEIWAFFARF